MGQSEGQMHASSSRAGFRPYRRLRRGRDDGAALVEMAFLIPILGMLLFGIIEFGYLMSFRGGLAQAAAEGARAAATSSRTGTPTPQDNALTAINQALGNYNKSCSSAGMTCTYPIVDCGGATHTAVLPDCMTVTVTYDEATYPVMPQIPLIDYAMPSTLSVSSTVELNNS